MFDKRFDVGFRLLFGVTSQIIQVAVYGEGWDAQLFAQSFRHAISVVGIIGAGLCVMKDHAVKLEEIMTVLNLLLFISLIPNNKQLRVCQPHAFKRLFRVQLVKYPAIAIGGSHNAGF